MKLNTSIAALVFLIYSLPSGKILKKAIMCDKQICFHTWPQISQIENWHQDESASEMYDAMAISPDGYTFNNAPVVIYAKATYRQKMPEVKSIEQYIKNDIQQVERQDSTIAISKGKEFLTKDNKRWQSYKFVPKSEGSWEQVAYGEEIDGDKNAYFLVFTISSRTKNDFESNSSVFESVISSYSTENNVK
jgi:hypothetical protein